MTILLTNGCTLDCEGVHGSPVNYQGVTRDCLTFLFSPNTSLDDLLKLFTPENCAMITVKDDFGTFIHENYTIRTGVGKGYKELAMRGVSGAGGTVKEEEKQVCWVSMTQSTLAERTLQNQQDTLDALIISALEP